MLIVQGRRLDALELARLSQWVSEQAGWSRRRLSVELAARWDWRNGAGVLKDMAARALLLKSTLGKAVRYLLHEYTALVGYLRDGRFEIDSNLVENDVRPSAVGKKRWLFLGHPEAGWRSAVIYTLIQSCRRYGINPQEYLTDILQRLPSMTTSQLPQLLPHRWKPSQQ